MRTFAIAALLGAALQSDVSGTYATCATCVVNNVDGFWCPGDIECFSASTDTCTADLASATIAWAGVLGCNASTTAASTMTIADRADAAVAVTGTVADILLTEAAQVSFTCTYDSKSAGCSVTPVAATDSTYFWSEPSSEEPASAAVATTVAIFLDGDDDDDDVDDHDATASLYTVAGSADSEASYTYNSAAAVASIMTVAAAAQLF
jgi:hypothetical protein